MADDTRDATMAISRPTDGESGGSAEPSFAIVMRGYERQQVDDAVHDLRRRLAEATRRFQAAEAALTSLRASAAEDARRRAEGRRPAPDQISERIRQMLRLAEEEADEIRAEAQREAEEALERGRRELADLQRRRQELNAELMRVREQVAALLVDNDPEQPAE